MKVGATVLVLSASDTTIRAFSGLLSGLYCHLLVFVSDRGHPSPSAVASIRSRTDPTHPTVTIPSEID